jgi:sodium-dependent dicarboxylate transporter 2/3/5
VVSHAVAALMLPLVLEIIRSLQLPPNSRLAKRLLLSLAWGTICGSNLTLQSSARASLAVELYRGWRADSGLTPDPVSFVDYTLSAAPAALAAVLLAGVTLRLMFPPQGLDLTPAITSLDERVRAAGRMKREEWLTVATVAGMLTTIVGWGLAHGLGTMALLWSAFLFATRVLDWEDAERYVNWGVALLYGGAIAVGASLERTGAAEWLVRALLPDVQFSPWVYFAALSLLAAGLTEVMSNAAVIALILPVALHLTDRIGVEPRALLFALPVCTGAAYALPTSTPAMALVFGTPYLRVRDTLVAGIVLAILCVAAFVALSALVWPLFGLRVVGGRP